MKNINKLGLLIGMGLMMTVGTMKGGFYFTSGAAAAEFARVLGIRIQGNMVAIS